MSTQTIERTLTDTDLEIIEQLETSPHDDTPDRERYAHYVKKDDIIAASFEGKAVYALCGKKWVASHNPEGLPVCPRCAEIHADPSNFRSIDPEEVRP